MGFADRIFSRRNVKNAAAGDRAVGAGILAGLLADDGIRIGNFPFVDFFNAVTGWDFSVADVLTAGERIQTLRQGFNVREGLKPSDIQLPGRMAGRPPQKEGPVANVTLDIDSLAHEYRRAMGWDPESGRPDEGTLEKLGLTALFRAHG